jgi:hypothetical protein
MLPLQESGGTIVVIFPSAGKSSLSEAHGTRGLIADANISRGKNDSLDRVDEVLINNQ